MQCCNEEGVALCQYQQTVI